MKTIRRTDSVPTSNRSAIERLTKRAAKSGFRIVEILERKLDGIEYRTFVLEGPRMATIKYFGTDILTGNFGKIRNIPGLLKLMFR